MEEVQEDTYNSSSAESSSIEDPYEEDLSSKKTSSKKWILVIIGLAVVALIFSIVAARAYAKEYYINKKSNSLREILLEQINSSNSQIQHIENANPENISEIKSLLEKNKEYVNKQINDFEKNGETKIYALDETFLCDGKKVNYAPNKLSECKDVRLLEKRGYKESIVNGTTAASAIVTNSLQIALIEYSLDVLSENQYELEKNLNELIEKSEIENEMTEEIKSKIKEIKKSSAPVVAQILNELLYLTKQPMITQVMVGIVRENENAWNERGRESMKRIREIAEEMGVPSEEQIRAVELKQLCIDLFDTLAKSSKIEINSAPEKILFISPSVSDICENLERYQKQHAINMLNRTKSEKNPFISIENKLYLNLLVSCSDEWIPTGRTGTCTNNYLNKFKETVSERLNR